jgi:hypothetical protein
MLASSRKGDGLQTLTDTGAGDAFTAIGQKFGPVALAADEVPTLVAQ